MINPLKTFFTKECVDIIRSGVGMSDYQQFFSMMGFNQRFDIKVSGIITQNIKTFRGRYWFGSLLSAVII